MSAIEPVGSRARLDGWGTDALDAATPQRAGERAYEYLRQAILRGAIPVGTTLGEEDLARELDMSRTPVRQALHQLLQDGLVEVGRRRQATVRQISPELCHEIFRVREALERIAVAHACRALEPADIDYLQLILIRQERAAGASPADFIDLDEEFHLAIPTRSQFGIVAKFLTELGAYIRLLGLEAVRRTDRMGQVISEHQKIVDGLERRDEETALRALSEHLTATARALKQPSPHRPVR